MKPHRSTDIKVGDRVLLSGDAVPPQNRGKVTKIIKNEIAGDDYTMLHVSLDNGMDAQVFWQDVVGVKHGSQTT